MGDTSELTLHQRLQALEESNICQKAQIEVLRSALSDLLVAHAMQTGDTNPIAAVREYCDYDYERGKSGDTERIPASFFVNRSGAFAELLERVFVSDLCGKYWRRSVFGWLDERRHQKVQRMQERINALSGL
jgi:hypothetical protein